MDSYIWVGFDDTSILYIFGVFLYLIYMQLLRRLSCLNSQVKVYYPFFLASDYTPLEYSPYYVRINLMIGTESCKAIRRHTQSTSDILYNSTQIPGESD
jgi:hypothetical protein